MKNIIARHLDQSRAHWREWVRDQIKKGNSHYLKDLLASLLGDDSPTWLREIMDDDGSLMMIAQLAGTQLNEALSSLAEEVIEEGAAK